jgi:hypothetical protein
VRETLATGIGNTKTALKIVPNVRRGFTHSRLTKIRRSWQSLSNLLGKAQDSANLGRRYL